MAYCSECSAPLPADALACPACGAMTGARAHAEDERVDVPPFDLARLRSELAASVAPRYEVLKQLGGGGMGTVFLAREPALKRLVAIKVLAPSLAADQTAVARFEREARMAAALSHPNVVQVYGVGETNAAKLPYIVMQYVAGKPLDVLIAEWKAEAEKQGTGVGERDARRILGEVAAALAVAHERDFVHRDVKPSNIMVEAAAGRAIVVDFGVAAAASAAARSDYPALTARGLLFGTLEYMSPEQAEGGVVDAKSDVYSLGLVAYELLSGELPYWAGSVSGWIEAHAKTVPAPLSRRRPDLSPALTGLVSRCLAKSPVHRPSAAEVAHALLPSTEADPQWPPPGLGALRGRARTLGGVALGATAAGLVAFLVLAAPPDAISFGADWWIRFRPVQEAAATALGVRSVASTDGSAAAALWRIVVCAGIGGFVIGLWTVLALAGGALPVLVRGHRVGWTWDTLTDVAADPDGRTGLLLAGARECAYLPAFDRHDILNERRRRAAAWLCAGVWGLLSFAIWGTLVATGLLAVLGLSTVEGLVVAALIAGPAAACSATGLAARRRERRLLGALSTRGIPTPSARGVAPVATPQAVAEWYAGVPDAGSPALARRGALGLVLSGAWLAAAVAAALVSLGLGGVALAAVTAGAVRRQLAVQVSEVPATLRHLDEEDAVGAARPVWESYLPRPRRVSDSVVNTWVRDLAAQPPKLRVELLRSGDSLLPLLQAAGRRGLSADTRQALAALVQLPWVGAVRQMAAAESVDVFAAALGGPVSEIPAPADVAARMLQLQRPLRDWAMANALAAVLAVGDGALDRAAARLGENAALAGHLLRAPDGSVNSLNSFGLVVLQNLALRPLAVIEELRQRPVQARALREAADRLSRYLGERPGWKQAAGLAGDPGDLGPFTRILGDQHLLPGHRVELLRAGLDGFCANAREILTGPAAPRAENVRAAGAAMPGVRYAPELAALVLRAWPEPSASPGGRLFQWGPRGTWARLVFCRRL